MLPVENYQAINMRNDYYPPGTVTALLETDLVTPVTHHILKARIETKDITVPRFFNAEMFITLQAVSRRLIPQTGEKKVDVAGILDTQLTAGRSHGWRYDAMPPDNKAFIDGLNGINETAMLLFASPFHLLNDELQDMVLRAVKCTMAPGEIWKKIPSHRFFEELNAALVEIYYSHPLAHENIGVVAMADAKGWQKIGLNELEVHEPKNINAV